MKKRNRLLLYAVSFMLLCICIGTISSAYAKPNNHYSNSKSNNNRNNKNNNKNNNKWFNGFSGKWFGNGGKNNDCNIGGNNGNNNNGNTDNGNIGNENIDNGNIGNENVDNGNINDGNNGNVDDGNISDNVIYASALIPNDASKGKENVQIFNQIFKQASENGIRNIIIPTETYYLDATHKDVTTPTNWQNIFVDVKSDITLDFNGSTFIQVNTAQPSYTMFSILNCENVTLKNGTLRGDTLGHDYTTFGGTHEFGFGIRIASSKNITITNMDIYEMTGDSILIDGIGSYGHYMEEAIANGAIMPENIQILNSKLHDNRRQGISVTGCNNLYVAGCEIYNIGQFMGTLPMAGIDLESDMGWAIDNSVIENNTFYNNANSAVTLAWSGREDATARNTIIRNNEVYGTLSAGYGDNTMIINNVIRDGGVSVSDTDIPTNTLIENNLFENARIFISKNEWVETRNNTINNGQIHYAVSGGVIYGNVISNDTHRDFAVRADVRNLKTGGNNTLYYYENEINGTYILGSPHFDYDGDFIIREMPPSR